MPIRFVLPSPPEEYVAFTYSPLLEAVLSLHVLAEPKHHPAQHSWVRQAARLPVTLRRQVDAFGFTFCSYFPEFVFPDATGGYPTFETELERLSGLPPELVALEFSRPLRRIPAVREPADLAMPTVRQEIRRALGELPEAQRPLASLVLDEPEHLLTAFQRLLRDYWDHAFAAEWSRIEDSLAEAVSTAGHEIAASGLGPALAGVSAELATASPGRELTLIVPRRHDHDVHLGSGQHLVLVPSIYVWPHVRVNCDRPWPLSLVYPAPAVRREGRVSIPPGELLRVLRGLADDTRLRLLKLTAQRPRSTQELAPLLYISEATCSKHLRILADAGILRSKREGYFVLYSLDRDRLASLHPSISSFLDGASS
jgi:DNA-binding transcriptional ArsR family regulator